ncbi:MULTISPECIES: LysR substrate-binding domain-containing protein [Stappiaceae]|jgi:DNA-binding transcriptional LysR family regulator|uniref:LysR substrate-binding domain-containing protein n=1 Tax=Stappiaceae TaxID=2821832 RepID=UPI0009295169|nr:MULTISPECIES: LysR substrate-binding domain-containing protein [Stappiaceae]MBO9423710.1 LysR family transcriptional regulator [Labrenzia sp. R4_1]OJJ13119.1 transcriptional regulator [Alphaproteobacteria bacterium AO1-B]
MSHALDIDQLRTFLAIAELGSFTKAGEAVHKTQSAVSMQMRRLEERVGQPIFIKDGRQSRLTEQGLRLVEYARRMIQLNDETLLAFNGKKEVGFVKLGVPDDYADRLLPQVLAAFNRLNPSIEVQVECTSSAKLTKAVRDNELDVAITTSGDTSELRGEIIRREPLYWVTSEQHSAHTQDVLRLALGPSSCSWRRLSMDALDRAGRQYRVSYTSASGSALIGAVQAGLALTVFPESAIRDGMRILDERDGFPALPHCDIAMLRSDNARLPMHDRLCNHIIAAIGNVGTVSSREAAE